MNKAPELLMAQHLKTLRLPTFLCEYNKQARICTAEGLDHVRYLARLTELELTDRERRIKSVKFPAAESLDSFDFKAIPILNEMRSWNWRGATGSSDGKMSSPLAPAVPAKPTLPSAWFGRIPIGPAGGVCDGRRIGQRTHGGPRRETSAAPPKTDG